MAAITFDCLRESTLISRKQNIVCSGVHSLINLNLYISIKVKFIYYIKWNFKASVSLIISFFHLFCSYSPNGIEPPPRWTCFLCALGLFIYQSLDSIDGKQARRTNTSSPLGELFDHGCDSISTIFVALSACISCQLGHYPNWLFFQVSTLISIWVSMKSMYI